MLTGLLLELASKRFGHQKSPAPRFGVKGETLWLNAQGLDQAQIQRSFEFSRDGREWYISISLGFYVFFGIYIYILADWNLEPDFGNLPYPEKVTGTNRSDLGKIDKIYNIFTFCETVHRNQNLEPLPKMARREPKMTTFSQ